MKYLKIIIISIITAGCSVYGGLTKCEGFDEAGAACSPVTENIKYSNIKEGNLTPGNKNIPDDNHIICDNTSKCLINIEYSILDKQVRNDEFARLTVNLKKGNLDTEPVLKPAKTIKITILPYSDGRKFYQARHVWIKTESEEWLVGGSMIVDKSGTVIMDKKAIYNENKSAVSMVQYNQPEIFEKEKSKPSPGDMATINVFYLNVRSEPTHESPITGVIPSGGKLKVLNERHGIWQRVSIVYYPDNELEKEYDGWVNSNYLIVIDEDESMEDM